MEKAYRIKANVTKDKFLSVNMKQDYETLDILSLSLNTENFYKLHTSNYGVIIGRVLANDAFGIPNAKISVFIELSDEDSVDTEISNYYPYTTTSSYDSDGRRYNLLPDVTNDDCYRIVGTFPNKRLVLDDETILEIYDKYWKYTTVTNNAGDYMIFGVPTGNQTIHVDLDLSDIGVLSQKPRDMYYKGYNLEQFDSSMQFKESTNLANLSQIFSQDQAVYVYPFWGDTDEGTIGISRCDIQIAYKFEPTCVFMGSLVSDNANNFIGHYCTPTKNCGRNNTLVTGEGVIEMIRKTIDGVTEEYQIKGNRLIDSDGVWCYQIPMNLDYVQTDEYGNVVPTDNPAKGIPTRTRVRFRISYAEGDTDGKTVHKAKMLVPNNPQLIVNEATPRIDNAWGVFEDYYEFGSDTPDECYRDLFWNKVYSIKSYIPRIQTSNSKATQNYTGIRTVNDNGNLTPFPFNNIRIRVSFAYTLLCIIFSFIMYLIYFINISFINLLCTLRNTCIVGFPKIKIGFIKFGGWCLLKGKVLLPFRVHCIGIKGSNLIDDGREVVFVPGCKCKDDTYCSDFSEVSDDCNLIDDLDELEDRIQETLAQEYDMIHLDFYNDWINGAVYLPNWYWKKTKKKKYFFGLFSRRAVDAYCECTYEKNYKNRNRIQTSFLCGTRREIATGRNTDGDGGDRWITSQSDDSHWPNIYTGVIRNKINSDGLNVYYYSFGNMQTWNGSADSMTPTYVRLFSNDLILLGSFNDCDLDGIPKLYRKLPNTTANVPFLITVYQNDGSEPEISGMDWEYDGEDSTPKYKKGMFFQISCTTADTVVKTCVNAQRMSELGVILDMNYQGNKPIAQSDNYGTMGAGDEIIADGMITRKEIHDNESRYMFASLNHLGLAQETTNPDTNYPVYKFGTLYPMDFDGSMNMARGYTNGATLDNMDSDYTTYRMGDAKIVGGHGYPDGTGDGTTTYYPLYNNSFYMYFGLNEGSTALDKFLTQYDAECFSNKTYPFGFLVSSTNGRYYQRQDCLSDYGTITISCDDITIPYTINVYNSDGEKVYEGKDVTEYTNTITSGNTDGHKSPLPNDTYTVELVDENDESHSKTVYISYNQLTADVTATGLNKKYYISETASEGEPQESLICANNTYNWGTISISGYSIYIDGQPYQISSLSTDRDLTKNKITVYNTSELNYFQNLSYDYDEAYEDWKNGDNYLFSGNPENATPVYENIIDYSVVKQYLEDNSKTGGTFIKIITWDNPTMSEEQLYGTRASSWNNFFKAFKDDTIDLYSANTETSKYDEISKTVDEAELQTLVTSDKVFECVTGYSDTDIQNYLVYGIIAKGDSNVNYSVYTSLDGYDIKETFDKIRNGSLIVYTLNTADNTYTQVDKNAYTSIQDLDNDIDNLYEDAKGEITYVVEVTPSGFTNNNDCNSYQQYQMKITLEFAGLDGDYTEAFEDCDCNDSTSSKTGEVASNTWDSVNKVFTVNVWKPGIYNVKLEVLPNDGNTSTVNNVFETNVEVTNSETLIAYINDMPTDFLVGDGTSGTYYQSNVANNNNAKSSAWDDGLDEFTMAEYKDTGIKTTYSMPNVARYVNKQIFEDIDDISVSYDDGVISSESSQLITKSYLTWYFNLLNGVYTTETGGTITYSGSGGKSPILARAQYPAYDYIENTPLDNQYTYNSGTKSVSMTVNPLTPNIIYKIDKYVNSPGKGTYGWSYMNNFTYNVIFNTDPDNSNTSVFKANYFGIIDNNGGFVGNKNVDKATYQKALSVPSPYITPIAKGGTNLTPISELDDSVSLDSEVIGRTGNGTLGVGKFNNYYPVPVVDRRLQHRIIVKNVNSDFSSYFKNRDLVNHQTFYFRTLGGVLMAYKRTDGDDDYSIIDSQANQKTNITDYFYDVYPNANGTNTTNYNDDYYAIYSYNPTAKTGTSISTTYHDFPMVRGYRKFYSFTLNSNDVVDEIKGVANSDGITYTSWKYEDENFRDDETNKTGNTSIKIDFSTCSYDVSIDEESFTYEDAKGYTYNLKRDTLKTQKGTDYSYTLKSNAKGYNRVTSSGNTYTSNPTESATTVMSANTMWVEAHANAYYTDLFSSNKKPTSISDCPDSIKVREVWNPNTSISVSDNLNYVVAEPVMIFNRDVEGLCAQFYSGDNSTYATYESGTHNEQGRNVSNSRKKVADKGLCLIYDYQSKLQDVKGDSTANMIYDVPCVTELTNLYGTMMDTDYKYEPYTNSQANPYNTDSDGSSVMDDSSNNYIYLNRTSGLDYNEYNSIVFMGDSHIDRPDYASWRIKTEMYDGDGNQIITRPYEGRRCVSMPLSYSNGYNNLAVFDLVKYTSDYTGITYDNSLEQSIYQNTLCGINYYPYVQMYMYGVNYQPTSTEGSSAYSDVKLVYYIFNNGFTDDVFSSFAYPKKTRLYYMVTPKQVYGKLADDYASLPINFKYPNEFITMDMDSAIINDLKNAYYSTIQGNPTYSWVWYTGVSSSYDLGTKCYSQLKVLTKEPTVYKVISPSVSGYNLNDEWAVYTGPIENTGATGAYSYFKSTSNSGQKNSLSQFSVTWVATGTSETFWIKDESSSAHSGTDYVVISNIQTNATSANTGTTKFANLNATTARTLTSTSGTSGTNWVSRTYTGLVPGKTYRLWFCYRKGNQDNDDNTNDFGYVGIPSYMATSIYDGTRLEPTQEIPSGRTFDHIELEYTISNSDIGDYVKGLTWADGHYSDAYDIFLRTELNVSFNYDPSFFYCFREEETQQDYKIFKILAT